MASEDCPPNSALGRSINVDFTSGESDSFTPQGDPTYDSNGASFTVTKDGDSPQLNSKWYIMFGHVEFVIKAAPGTGIVSSAVLESDVLDEIDWEWLGGDNQQVQSNYFGQGKTLDYNRGAYHAAPGNQGGFKTYAIDWTADRIIWSIDGTSVRELDSSTASEYPYPQTPMMVKVGAWCGGCASNEPGTIGKHSQTGRLLQRLTHKPQNGQEDHLTSPTEAQQCRLNRSQLKTTRPAPNTNTLALMAHGNLSTPWGAQSIRKAERARLREGIHQ